MRLCDSCGLSLAQQGRKKCRPCRYAKTEKKKALPRIKNQNVGQRILLIDIETSPIISQHWGLFKQNIGINQILVPKATLCYAAKWYGEDEIVFQSRWEDGQEAMVRGVWKLMNEADIIVHFYGSRFDVPHLNTEFLLHGITPPRPFKQIDLKLAVGKTFYFTSNRLQFVSEALGLAGKEEHEGHGLWSKTINFLNQYDEETVLDAQARMKSYNVQDTNLLEEVYEVVLPWIPGHPHGHLYNGTDSGCPKCGDEVALIPDGYAYTGLSKYEQFRCPTCGEHFRSGRRIDGAGVRQTVR